MNSTFTSSPEFTPNSSFGIYEFANSGTSGTSTRTEVEINYPDDTEIESISWDQLESISWNQDYSCFAAGTTSGFRIYSCDPFRETFRRDLKNGGFRIVEMLFRSNILALVGCGGHSQYSPNKALIWDDHMSQCIGEFTFRSEVRAVKLRRDCIVVILEHKIYVYNFSDLKLQHQIETLSNPRGLCCLSHHVNTFALACPGRRRGQVRVEHFGLHLTKFIQAHDSQIACLTLTMDGLLLATASVKGTLIRVFNTMDGTCLQEVRRGTEKADIYGIAFSPNVQWLAVSSDKGTVHIFSLRVRITSEDAAARPNFVPSPSLIHQNSGSLVDPLISPDAGANPSLSLSFMKGVLPKYFSSEWSFARFHLSDCARSIVGFGSHNTVNVVTLDGSFYRCKFDPVNGGPMSLVECIEFFQTESGAR